MKLKSVDHCFSSDDSNIAAAVCQQKKQNHMRCRVPWEISVIESNKLIQRCMHILYLYVHVD